MRLFFALVVFSLLLGITLYLTREWQEYKIDSEELKRDFYRNIRDKK